MDGKKTWIESILFRQVVAALTHPSVIASSSRLPRHRFLIITVASLLPISPPFLISILPRLPFPCHSSSVVPFPFTIIASNSPSSPSNKDRINEKCREDKKKKKKKRDTRSLSSPLWYFFSSFSLELQLLDTQDKKNPPICKDELPRRAKSLRRRRQDGGTIRKSGRNGDNDHVTQELFFYMNRIITIET